MKKICKALSVFLSVMMVLSIIPVTAFAAPDPYSGTCGDNLFWSYDETAGTLTISGEGDMYDDPFDDSEWFDLKSEIVNVVIEDGVTSIGDTAFELFVNLKSITIPESVTAIGAYAFDECDSLTKIVLHDGITKIGDGAFSNCDYLDTVVIPGTVTEFGDAVFASCDRLANVTLCDGLVDIGLSTFDDCKSLTDIVIPESITRLRGGNFTGCVNLKSITFSVKLEAVGYGTFGDCINLQDVYYTGTEEDLLYLESMPLGKNEPLFAANFHCESTIHRHSYVKTSEHVVEFYNDDGYTTYTCECGHSYNGDYVKWTEHSFDNGVVTTNPTCTADGVKTFTCSKCGGTYTEAVTKTGHSYDDGVITKEPTCSSNGIKTFTCGSCGDKYTESVDDDSSHNYELVVNTSPSETECVKKYKCTICGDTYSKSVGSSGHTKVAVPEVAPTETKYGLTAGIVCSYCGGVFVKQEIIPALGTNDDPSVIVSGTCGTSVNWTYNKETYVLTISGTGAMNRYKSTQSTPWDGYKSEIKSIIIEEGVTTIGNYAFKNCTSLIYVSIPDTLTQIGSNAFLGCSSLRSVTMSDSVDTVTSCAFKNCTSLISVRLSNNISYIEDSLFEGCSSLIHVTVPDSVYYINANAFANCKKLKSVTIGANTIIVYANAFKNCNALTTVHYVGTEEQWNAISVVETGNAPLTGANIYYNSTNDNDIEGHKHNYTVTESKPGCTEAGYTRFVCDCGYEYIENYPAHGHLFVEIPVVLPTSTSEGFTGGEKCLYCDMVTVKPLMVPKINEGVIAGEAGRDIIWTYDSETMTLEFFGKGAMPDYDPTKEIANVPDECPWPTYSGMTYIVVHEGITQIGDCSFYGMRALSRISLPSTLTFVSRAAFYNCGYFDVVYAGTEEDWNNKVTVYNSGNNSLKNATFYYSDYDGVLDSGTHGDNITWVYDGLTYTLIISGTGPMQNATVATLFDYPWEIFKSSVKNIVIEEGVTTIAANAFWQFTFTKITLPNTLTTIGSKAFYDCNYFESITFPASLTEIKNGAFSSADGISDIYYMGTEEQWKNNVNKSGLSYYENSWWPITYHFTDSTEIRDNHFYLKGEMQKAYQLIELNGDFYFIGDRHEIVRNKKAYLSEARINGLTYADGTPITPGYYDFDEEGKMVILNGLVGDKIYVNNTMLKAYQIVRINRNIYFIGDRHEIVKNKQVYLSESRINGVTYANGTPIVEGYYEFDENGKMIMRDGIVGNCIYKNNVQLKAYQLVEVDGDFYFIGDRHEIVKDKQIYLNEARINGLTYADGTPITPGYYNVDENGKLIIINGIVGNKIYKNNVQLKAYQLVEIDGDFYFIGDRHEIVKNQKIYLNEARINGLTYADGTPISVGYYNVDADGKMIILNGVVDGYVYKNNTQLKAYQLVEVDGDFYFIGDRHQVSINRRIYLTEERINGLTFEDGTPITPGYYVFDEYGRMIIE